MVTQGAAIARLRTTGGDIVALRAPAAGKLAQRSPQIGSFVRSGDVVATIEPAGANPVAVVFVPVETDRRVAVGMPVRLSPADARPDVFGFLRGHVTYTAPFPASADRIKAALQNDAVAATFSPDVPVREVHIAVDVDEHGQLVWSGLRNAGRTLSPGMPCSATIVVDQRAPVTFLLPQSQARS
jgi:multidrug efflux pump subunit AcrA (membrane-fusion protein)